MLIKMEVFHCLLFTCLWRTYYILLCNMKNNKSNLKKGKQHGQLKTVPQRGSYKPGPEAQGCCQRISGRERADDRFLQSRMPITGGLSGWTLSPRHAFQSALNKSLTSPLYISCEKVARPQGWFWVCANLEKIRYLQILYFILATKVLVAHQNWNAQTVICRSITAPEKWGKLEAEPNSCLTNFILFIYLLY